MLRGEREGNEVDCPLPSVSTRGLVRWIRNTYRLPPTAYRYRRRRQRQRLGGCRVVVACVAWLGGNGFGHYPTTRVEKQKARPHEQVSKLILEQLVMSGCT